MRKLPKHILKLLASCYGSWEDSNKCCECELCIVCRTYSDYPITDNIGKQLLREKRWMKRHKQTSHRDNEHCQVHDRIDKVLNSERECHECICHGYEFQEDEELWAMTLAANVNLEICKKCKAGRKQKENDPCIIYQYMDQWSGFEKQIVPENMLIPRPVSFEEDFRAWCPFFLEHLLSRDKTVK